MLEEQRHESSWRRARGSLKAGDWQHVAKRMDRRGERGSSVQRQDHKEPPLTTVTGGTMPTSINC